MSGSPERRRVDAGREVSAALLRPVVDLFFLLGLKLFAFRRLDVHHNCRSSARDEVTELRELVTEGVVECRERSFAFLSLRSPTFSVFGSAHERSAENITNKVEQNVL